MAKAVKIKELLFILIICLPGFLLAKEKIDFKTIDSISYQQFQNKEWKALIRTCKLGLDNGIDYYYLRMRKGIAEFEEENYINASTDFQKALEFNHYDKTAKSYYYFSLLNSGKRTEAYRYSKTFSDNQKAELKIQIKPVENLYFFGGYSFSNNDKKNGSINMLANGAVYGEQLLMGNQIYLHLGATFNLSHSFSLYSSVSYLNINKTNRFQYKLERFYIANQIPRPGGGYYNEFAVRDEITEQVFDTHINQAEVYLNGKIQMDQGWSLNLFTNLLFISTTQFQARPTSNIRRDTLSYNKPQNTYEYVNHEVLDYTINSNDTSFMDWLVGFNIQKDFKYIGIGLSAAASKFYDNNLYQSLLSATYYPLGNLKFYGTSGITYVYEPEAVYTSDVSRFIFSQQLGVQLSKHLWLEGEYLYGNLKNTSVKQGLIVYNLPDKINYIAGVKLYIFVNEHMTFNLIYHLSDKTAYYTSFVNDFEIYTTKYQTHNIIGGIKWTF